MQLKLLVPMLAAASTLSPVPFTAAQPAPGPSGTNDTKAFYDRLPAKADGKVRQPVWDLSRDAAGMCVHLVTDATTLQVRWALPNSWLYLPNMTAIGKSGLDLYSPLFTGSGRTFAHQHEIARLPDLKRARRQARNDTGPRLAVDQ